MDERPADLAGVREAGKGQSFVRAIHAHVRERNQPSTTTEEARSV
jgi:hypothetical protein